MKEWVYFDKKNKFLVNPSNKMWNNIDELNREFLLLVTGTPL